MIDIEDLVKKYKGKSVLDIEELVIKDGEVVGLVGNNGAGKTTLMRVIAGHITPTDGECIIDNVPMKTLMDMSHKVALIDEKMRYPVNSKLKNIITEYGEIIEGFDDVRAMKYLKYFALDENKRINSLSKGMKNIFNMIIGFCLPHKVILFDEITSGMDEFARLKFKKVLIQEMIDRPKVYLLSTHLFGEISDTVQRVVLLKNGEIAIDCKIEAVSETMLTIQGSKEILDKALKGITTYAYSQAGGFVETTVLNELDRRTKSYLQENNIQYCLTSVSQVCALIANVQPWQYGGEHDEIL